MRKRENPMVAINELKPRAMSWLWANRVPLGKLTMFDGDPGRGKSMVTLNKAATSRSLYRGGGSIGFNAVCRSSWLFDHDPDDHDRLVMAQIKNNFATRQQSLAYRIVGQDGAEPTLEWLGLNPLTADQLL